ncbi:MAG TPA: hypothetical protein VF532_24410 [Candidatus Angelobacter sp.]
MSGDFTTLWQWTREKWLPLRPLTPFLASGLTLGAGFCTVRPLRIFLLCLALGLFLEVAADFARTLLDRETGYASYQGPPQTIPVTPAQLALAGALALVYFFMIFAGLAMFFLPSGLGLVLIVLGVLALSSLAAWRNVRLWWREGADYEQALKEESNMSHKLRIPPVR